MLELIAQDHENPEKSYLPVWAYYNAAGDIRPVALQWGDKRYVIDRVLDVRPQASRKLGGAGIRYLCRVQDRTIELFLEEKRWFIASSSWD